jgi:hypothetical protein
MILALGFSLNNNSAVIQGEQQQQMDQLDKSMQILTG